MNGKPEAVELTLDTLTTSTRFLAGLAPKAATRVSLGVALAIEDSATDQTGRLLGAKVRQGASVLASSIGSVASSVRESARSKAARLVSEDGSLASLPGVDNARGFVSQAVSEVRGAWADAGYVSVPVEGQSAPETDALASSSDGTEPDSVTNTHSRGAYGAVETML